MDGTVRELDLLGTFLEVYRAGSITAGAARLGLSQPAVSERLARLEEQFGAALFTRSRAGVSPTSDGDRLAARIGEPVDRLRTVWDVSPEPSGLVRVGGASDVVASRVIPALAPLVSRGVTVSFTLGLASDLLAGVRDGALDLAVSSVRTPMRGVSYRALVDEEFVLVGAPSLARTIDPKRIVDDPSGALAHLPLVAYDDDLSIVRRYWRSQFGRRPANTVQLIVGDLRGILAAVIAGAGISALPRYLADPAIATGSVELVHRTDDPPINTLYLAIPANAPPSAAMARVIDTLVEKAREWDTL